MLFKAADPVRSAAAAEGAAQALPLEIGGRDCRFPFPRALKVSAGDRDLPFCPVAVSKQPFLSSSGSGELGPWAGLTPPGSFVSAELLHSLFLDLCFPL